MATSAAMGLVAAAAYAGLSGDSLTAMSTVISTAFAGAAVVASLGLADLRKGGTRNTNGVDGALRSAERGLRIWAADGHVEVDLDVGNVRFVHGGLSIALTLNPDQIVVKSSAGN